MGEPRTRADDGMDVLAKLPRLDATQAIWMTLSTAFPAHIFMCTDGDEEDATGDNGLVDEAAVGG